MRNKWASLIDAKNKFPIGCKVRHVVPTYGEWEVYGYRFTRDGVRGKSEIMLQIDDTGVYFIETRVVVRIK